MCQQTLSTENISVGILYQRFEKANPSIRARNIETPSGRRQHQLYENSQHKQVGTIMDIIDNYNTNIVRHCCKSANLYKAARSLTSFRNFCLHIRKIYQLLEAYARTDPTGGYEPNIEMRLFILVRIMILLTMSPFLLGLINFSSTATFNAIASMTLIGLCSSCLLPITHSRFCRNLARRAFLSALEAWVGMDPF